MMLYLLRHGQVEERYQECYNGWLDVALSSEGQEEAKTLARCLSHIQFDAVYCSDLFRCKRSIAYFDSEYVIYDINLREKHWGECEGLDYETVCQKLRIKYVSFYQWIRDMGGESLEEFKARITSVFFERIIPSGGEKVLVMTHAGVIRMLLSIVTGESIEACFNLAVPTACYTIIEKKPVGWIVHKVGVQYSV
ncbi:MAG: histidine phosphatase family protein [bacterium]